MRPKLLSPAVARLGAFFARSGGGRRGPAAGPEEGPEGQLPARAAFDIAGGPAPRLTLRGCGSSVGVGDRPGGCSGL